ncbi:MAG: twin-arginine translocase TatA/TatE family subunit [Candidatus Competibacteraceae bacterium]|nr:twin-arginine translocase TatA/TatE family subunit [Candidatus Competibacteraceae bacterium]
MGGISIWQLLIILLIVLVLFGGNRLRNLGSDLGTAIRGFRNAMKEGGQPETAGEENPKKLEQPTLREHSGGGATAGLHDPLAKNHDKV